MTHLECKPFSPKKPTKCPSALFQKCHAELLKFIIGSVSLCFEVISPHGNIEGSAKKNPAHNWKYMKSTSFITYTFQKTIRKPNPIVF